MAPPCKECRLVHTVGVVAPFTFTFHCTMNGETREFTFSMDTLLAAEIYICTKIETDWMDGTVVPKKGGSGGCIPLATLVRMANGGTKPAGELALGDEILSSALESREVISRRLVGLFYDYDADLVRLTNSANESLVTSAEQPIITSSGPVRAQYVFIGSTVFRLDDERNEVRRDEFTITKREALRERGDVVSLDLGDDHCFFTSERFILGCHSKPVGPVKKM
jgi:hypothetical protein